MTGALCDTIAQKEFVNNIGIPALVKCMTRDNQNLIVESRFINEIGVLRRAFGLRLSIYDDIHLPCTLNDFNLLLNLLRRLDISEPYVPCTNYEKRMAVVGANATAFEYLEGLSVDEAFKIALAAEVAECGRAIDICAIYMLNMANR